MRETTNPLTKQEMVIFQSKTENDSNVDRKVKSSQIKDSPFLFIVTFASVLG